MKTERKKFIKYGVSVLLLLCVVITVAVYVSNLYTLPEGFTVTAHSGSEDTPDNSMEFLEKCMEIDVAVLEIDVTFRADGTPVMLHSDVAKENEGVLFDDAIRYIAENSDTVRVNLDLKSVANLAGILEILDKYGIRERCFYTGVTDDFVEEVRKNGGLPYYLNVSFMKFKKNSTKELEKLCQKVKDSGAIGINCNKKLASKKMVKLFHKNGLLVSCWTANDGKSMKKLLLTEPDNITTRYPVMLNEMIEKSN